MTAMVQARASDFSNDWFSHNIPPQGELLAQLHALARTEDPIARYLAAYETNQFVHPDGRTDPLHLARLTPAQGALISFLCRVSPKNFSVEVGFGMGSSAAIILATLNANGNPFEHVIFDPFGLPDGSGAVVQSYLEQTFGTKFNRVKETSEIGLGGLISERGSGSAGFIFIDGGHHFENVMIDFVLSDQLCAEGGHIVFDDAAYPAIETVINYVIANRADYAVAHLPAINTAVLKKIGPNRREWYEFKPFAVPNREDWTPSVS